MTLGMTSGRKNRVKVHAGGRRGAVLTDVVGHWPLCTVHPATSQYAAAMLGQNPPPREPPQNSCEDITPSAKLVEGGGGRHGPCSCDVGVSTLWLGCVQAGSWHTRQSDVGGGEGKRLPQRKR